MSDYEICVTAVSERDDLFAQSLDSLLANVDQPPVRVIVHEDVRRGTTAGAIWSHLETARLAGRIPVFVHQIRDPAHGMGPALKWTLEQARTPIVLYTQDDWLVLRPLPIGRALEIMRGGGLNHVRFNKRKTMPSKHADTPHPWMKVEVSVGVGGQIAGAPDAHDHTIGVHEVLCVSDHWYTQTSLWRVGAILPAVQAVADRTPQANEFVAALNNRINVSIGDGRPWNDQAMRHERHKTYIWGPVGEPAFIKHLGSGRTTGPIDHLKRAAR